MCISPKTNRSTSPRSLLSSPMGDDSAVDNNNHTMQIQQHQGGKAVVVHSASSTTAQEDHHHHRRGGHPHNNRRFIIAQHDYHDHANDSSPRMGSGKLTAADLLPPRGSPGGSTSPAAFPVKLYEMLESVVTDGYENVVSWQPHGRCFVVHQAKYFQQHLLPRYFGGLSKMASFQRQLNLYGFMRLSRGPDKGGYYHELFLRSKPFLMHRIQRIKVKGTGVRARSNPDQEPDFWNMPWVGEGAGTGSSAPSNKQMQPQQQPQATTYIPSSPPPPQANSKPMIPSSSAATSVGVSHGYMQHMQQLSSAIRVLAVERQVPSRQDLPKTAKPQALAHSSHQQPRFLDRAVEPLNHSFSKAVSPPSSGSEDEEFDNHSSTSGGDEDDNNMVIMEGWGKPFYVLDALPKPPHHAKENGPVQTTTTMSSSPVQSSPYRPLRPAPRMFISKPTFPPPSPPPPPAAAAAAAPPSTMSTFEFDAIDFFMDDVLNCNHGHHHHRKPSNHERQQGNSQDAEFFAEMLERIVE